MGMEKGGAIIGPCPTPHPPHIGMETYKSRIRTHKAYKLRYEIKRKRQVGDGHKLLCQNVTCCGGFVPGIWGKPLPLLKPIPLFHILTNLKS